MVPSFAFRFKNIEFEGAPDGSVARRAHGNKMRTERFHEPVIIRILAESSQRVDFKDKDAERVQVFRGLGDGLPPPVKREYVVETIERAKDDIKRLGESERR